MRYENGKKGNKLTYSQYRDKFNKTLLKLRIKKHTPHECRHTLASLLDNANANTTATKRILGHASNDITHKVYTHKDLKQLKKAMSAIKFRN